MISPVESLWLAPVAVAIAIIATSPAWLFGRARGWVKPGIALRWRITAKAGTRWTVFATAAVVAFMTWALGMNTGQLALFAIAALSMAVCVFYAYMIGAGANDQVRAHREQPGAAAVTVPLPLDEMDHELIQMLDDETPAR